MISRAVAEDYLTRAPAGMFLLRVSERYFGYGSVVLVRLPALLILNFTHVGTLSQRDLRIVSSTTKWWLKRGFILWRASQGLTKPFTIW